MDSSLLPIVSVTILIVAVPLYLGWRFVRALERRGDAATQLDALNLELSALGEQAALMADSLNELTQHRSAASLPPSTHDAPDSGGESRNTIPMPRKAGL